MCAEEPVSIARDIVVTLSAIAVAIAASVGIRTWRKELTGKAKFEVARNIMQLASKLRDDFGRARNPLTYHPFESADRVPKASETAAESTVLDEWHARTKRLQPLVENLRQFQEASWEAEIVLDEGASSHVSSAFEVYRQHYAELLSSIDSYFRVTHQESVSGKQYQDKKWLESLHETIYSRPDDEFSKQIDEATKQLGPVLKMYVK